MTATTATTTAPVAATPADPGLALDLRDAARRLVTDPLVLAESDPDMFLTIRRHEQKLDRWFTQRFGYRLQVTADTARLFKTTVVATRRPLRTATSQSRPFSGREYTMLALALAAVAAGPSVISLRDLIDEIRSAAIDAEVALTEESADRRALVTALRWMIRHGLAGEMHDRIDRYATDRAADAVLRIRPDRIALLPLPALARSETVGQVLDRSAQRLSARAWMRALLLEEPVLYRTDLADGEWAELRNRLNEESAILGEMFGLDIEARAEGVMAIDPEDGLTDSRFPQTATVGHAALLLIDPARQPGPERRQQAWEMGADPLQAAGYGAGHALDLGELFGHVVDQHPGEELDLVGVEVIAALPQVELGEELGQLGGEALVEVEHGPHRGSEVGGGGSIEPGLGVLAQLRQGPVQVAQSARLHVADLVNPGQHPLDQLEHLLTGAGDQIAVAPPVVVVEARRVADRRRHREVPPAPEAFEPIGDHSRVDPGFGRGRRHLLGRELGEERAGEHLENGPVLVPFIAAEIPEQQPGMSRIIAGVATAPAGAVRFAGHRPARRSRLVPSQW